MWFNFKSLTCAYRNFKLKSSTHTCKQLEANSWFLSSVKFVKAHCENQGRRRQKSKTDNLNPR